MLLTPGVRPRDKQNRSMNEGKKLLGAVTIVLDTRRAYGYDVVEVECTLLLFDTSFKRRKATDGECF